MKILNIGSGTGGNSRYVSRFAETVSVDLSKHALRLSRKKIREPGICALAERLPFKDNSFDFALGLDVLEHIPGQAEAVRELHRVLKKNKGLILITVPAFGWMWTWRDEIAGHQRRYSKVTLLQVLSDGGFESILCSYYSTFLFPLYLLDRLLAGTKSETKPEKVFPAGKGLVNSLLRRIFLLERHFLPRPGFPFGKSLICLGRTKTRSD